MLLRPREVQVDDRLEPSGALPRPVRRFMRPTDRSGLGPPRTSRPWSPAGPVLAEDVVGHDEGAALRRGPGGRAASFGGAASPAPRASAPARGSRRCSRSARKRTICSGWRPARRSARPGSGRRRPRAPPARLRTLEDAGPLLVHQGLVEPAEPDAAGRVPDDREPSWVARTSRSSSCRSSSAEESTRRGLRDPALQHARDQMDVGTGTPLGEVDPEDRLLEFGVRSSSVTPYRPAPRSSRSRKCSFSPWRSTSRLCR